MEDNEYSFSEDWVTKRETFITPLLSIIKPKRILEVGSFEGRSSTYFIRQLKDVVDGLEITCVDPWEQYFELKNKNFVDVEAKFRRNIAIATADGKSKVNIMKGKSIEVLSSLVAQRVPQYDFVYIDGSHVAVDVFADAALGFHLLRNGGLLIFDDFSTANMLSDFNIYDHPNIAIQSFINTHHNLISSVMFDVLVDGEPRKANGAKDTYQCYLVKK